MPSSSLSPEIAATLLELARRVKHADENPIVPGAPNGDQNHIVIWHKEMAPLIQCPLFAGPEWQVLRTQYDKQQGLALGRYPGAWVRAMVEAGKEGVE